MMDKATRLQYASSLERLVAEGKISRSSFAYQQIRAALHDGEPKETHIPAGGLGYPFNCTPSIKLALNLLNLTFDCDGLTFGNLQPGTALAR